MAKGRDIVIDLKVKAKDAISGLKDFGKGLDDAGDKAEKSGGRFKAFGDRLSSIGDNVGKGFTGKLGAAGEAADTLGLGLDDIGGKAGLAGAAVGGLATIIGGGISKMRELTDNTREFNRVAGTSWEDGSRLLAVFQDLRIDVDDAKDSMAEFANTVGQSPEDLKQFGIEIAKANDGSVDMARTLENVADRFEKTRDPARRAAMGSALFGEEWHRIAPFLDQGGEKIRELAANIDESRVVSAESAAEQDKLNESTRELSQQFTELQMKLASDVLPNLVTVLSTMADGVGIVSDLADALKKVTYESEHQPDDAIFATVGERLKAATEKAMAAEAAIKTFGQTGSLAVSVLGQGVDGLNSAMKTHASRIDDAREEYDDFKKSVEDLIQKQEDMRKAQLDSEDSALALEDAQVRAGDASWELSDSAHQVENAVRDYGAESEEAAIATEEHNRKLREARGAMNDSAAAAVEHARKVAEGNGVTLTAAQETAIYRDELIRLRQGAEDPALAAAMDAQIERLRLVAERAQDAKEDLQGLNEAIATSAGIETNFTGRNAGGGAVIRRATGGPVWPGQTAYVHQDELINFPTGSGPAHVLSAPEAARFMSDPANGFMGLSMPGGRISRLPAPGSAVRPMGFQTPLGLGEFDVTSGGLSLRSQSFGGGAGVINYYITINGYADISKLVDAIRAYDRQRAA